MNWENIISIFASSIAISISTYYLTKGKNKEIKRNIKGFYVLCLPEMYKYIGFISVLIILIFTIATFIKPDNLMLAMTGMMTALFGGFGIPCLVSYLNYKLEFNDTNIKVTNWRKKRTQIGWDEIENIKYSPMSGYISIFSKNDKLKINHHLDGINIFKKMIDEKTRWKSKELRIP